MNFQSCCTIQNLENKKSLCTHSLSLTTRPRMSATQNRAHGGAADSSRPKRVDGETPARWTAPSRSTSPREPIPTLRIVVGTPEEAPRQPWRPRWRKHGGARHNSSYNAVETKAKRASRSGTHHEHDGMLGEGGDGLEWPDHGEARSTVVRPAVRKKSMAASPRQFQATMVG